MNWSQFMYVVHLAVISCNMQGKKLLYSLIQPLTFFTSVQTVVFTSALTSMIGIKVLLISKYYWSTRYPGANITRYWFQYCFNSQASTQLQISRVFTGRVLTNDCSHPQPPNRLVRTRSRLDHFPVMRPKEFATNDSGNRDSSNRGRMSTATNNKRKTRDKKV